jgi:hypothetical protein
MRGSFRAVGVLAIQLSSSLPYAQQTNQLQIRTEAPGFASLSDSKLGHRPIQGGRELPELSFEVSITEKPPCNNLVIYFDLLSPSGAYTARNLMAAGSVDELKNVRQGGRYMARVVNRDLMSAGSIIIRPSCSYIR